MQALPLLEVLSTVAKERGKTQSQVALQWCIAKGTIPIPGTIPGCCPAAAPQRPLHPAWLALAEPCAL